LCAGLGLGYGSGSESDDDDADRTSAPGHRGGESSGAVESSEDEELMHDRIRRKKIAFEKKMRQLEEQRGDDG